MKPWAQRTLAAGSALTVEALGGLWAWFAGTLAVVAGVWLWRLYKHPMGPCRWCKGRSGRNAGSDETQWGKCARCEKSPGGGGEQPRLGAVLVHPELRRKK